MKNPTKKQLVALRERARQIADSLSPKGVGGSSSSERRAAFEAAARRVLRVNRAVGAAVALSRPGFGEVFLFDGFARLHPAKPVTNRTCFRVASVSKTVMTFGVLSLVQSGLLCLDEDIGLLLGYPARNPAYPGRPVTLRMLLTHTSGLRDEGPYGRRGMQRGTSLRSLLDDPACWLAQPPGADFHYSNLGAGVVGVLCERATRKPLYAVMDERIFKPLGIRAAFGPQYIHPADDLADGYAVRGLLPPRLRYDAAALAAAPTQPFDPEHDFLCAPGRMVTDARSLLTLAKLLASREDTSVLSAQSLSCMRSVQDGVGGIVHAGRGLNTALLPDVFDGFSPVGHQGVAYGMCCEFFADPPSGAAVCVMLNGVRLCREEPLVRAGFDLLCLGFALLRE